MLKCIPVFQGAVPNASLLCYDALYLLCAHENILEQQENERVLWVLLTCLLANLHFYSFFLL